MAGTAVQRGDRGGVGQPICADRARSGILDPNTEPNFGAKPNQPGCSGGSPEFAIFAWNDAGNDDSTHLTASQESLHKLTR